MAEHPPACKPSAPSAASRAFGFRLGKAMPYPVWSGNFPRNQPPVGKVSPSAGAYDQCHKPAAGRQIALPPPSQKAAGTSVRPEKRITQMTRTLLLSLMLAGSPLAALAFPVVGDVVGTNPEEATAALKALGCEAGEFEPEDGKIETKCVDPATSKMMEVYIDPKTGAVTEIKLED
jgi:hypothetical protein